MKPKHIKPIIFNTDMVRAILEGRKTVTRRIIKPQPLFYTGRNYVFADETCPKKWEDCDDFVGKCAPYQVGDILYVRETWGDYRECTEDSGGVYVLYRADYPDGAKQVTHPDGIVYELPKWHPSIHMPKEAARIWLRVTDVRVERLHGMNDEEAEKEGIGKLFIEDVAFGNKDYGCVEYSDSKGYLGLAKEQFAYLWDSTIKKNDLPQYGWSANPWVFVIQFERCENPDLLEVNDNG